MCSAIFHSPILPPRSKKSKIKPERYLVGVILFTTELIVASIPPDGGKAETEGILSKAPTGTEFMAHDSSYLPSVSSRKCQGNQSHSVFRNCSVHAEK